MKFKTLCLLLSLCHAGAAAALGLGEINVRSSLGQPLHATVAILGANGGMTADCFSVQPSPGGIAPPPRAQLSIEQSAGQTLLHIRTRQAIFDPIAQFSLISECEARLQRDYVVLLDPPTAISPAISEDAPAPAQSTASAAPEAPASRPVRPHHHVKRVHAAVHSTAAASRRPVASRRHASHPAAPRLVLSGQQRNRPEDMAFSLRPDVNLPDLSQPRPDALTATEISDENTALAHKLAYLEAQLIALQKRNAELEAKQAAAAAKAAIPPPQQPAQWPLYLLAVGLVAGGGGLFAWLLRRNRQPRRESLGSPAWGQEETPIKTLSEMTQEVEETPPAPQRMPDIAPPPRIEGTEVKEDILDQAEVFMAHGHGELAVHLLQEHLREAPTESPVPWLLLLDLLHREGDTAGYAAASAECRRYFNVNLSGHPISQDSEEGQGLEAYPHLLEQLVNVWNTPDVDAFFHDLIYDNRGGTRMGFEPGAYRDILLLREIANSSLKLAA